MNMEAAIFDVDGTLIDSMGMWNQCGERYLRARGLKATDDLSDRMRVLPIGESGKLLKRLYDLPETAEEVTAGLNAIAHDFYMNEAELKPYIPELLETLRRAGIPMTVATASAHDVVDRVLTHLGIRGYFNEILSCDDLGLNKRQPRFFVKCAARLNTDPRKTWVFEDVIHAVETARMAGLPVAGMYDEESRDNEAKIRVLAHRYLKTREDFERFAEDVVGVPLG
jgi:HAD superfamily hydrolase (TIGR01509 family)